LRDSELLNYNLLRTSHPVAERTKFVSHISGFRSLETTY
jgi:hypothetical protein